MKCGTSRHDNRRFCHRANVDNAFGVSAFVLLLLSMASEHQEKYRKQNRHGNGIAKHEPCVANKAFAERCERIERRNQKS
jgi:hypothetical protein